MGLFSSSKKSTTNQDNRVINDYSGANLDYSQRHDNSISGANANNSGTINTTITDGGAFDLVAHSNSNMAALAETGMELGFQLGSEGLSAGTAIGRDSLALADGALSNAASLIDNQSQRSLDSALAVHSTGLQQLSMGSDLAYGLAQINQDASLQQQENNNDALTNGFKSMMQFADSYSRSDGAMVAETNMKTVGVLAVSAVLAVFIFKKVK